MVHLLVFMALIWAPAGLVPCLKANVMHRDISLSNIAINVQSEEPECILFDFDMAMEWPPSENPLPIHWDISVSICLNIWSLEILRLLFRVSSALGPLPSTILLSDTGHPMTLNLSSGFSFRCLFSTLLPLRLIT